ncbi:hypothetical protein Tco_0152346 [Tanacetum coccineum]
MAVNEASQGRCPAFTCCKETNDGFMICRKHCVRSNNLFEFLREIAGMDDGNLEGRKGIPKNRFTGSHLTYVLQGGALVLSSASSRMRLQAVSDPEQCATMPLIICSTKQYGHNYINTCNEIIVLSSDSSDGRKGPSKATVSIFEGPSIQGLLDHYGYNDIEKYLSWNYFPSTDKENTDKDIIDEDCIHEYNYSMSKSKCLPVSEKHNSKVKSPVPVRGCVLGLTNVTTWDEIVNKIGVRKSKICAEKAKGKRKVSYES